MPKSLDITGQKFGKLTALRRAPSRNGKTYWVCKCDCGKEKEIQTSHLRDGSTISCGSADCKKNNQIEIDNYLYKKQCPICQKQFQTNFKNRLYCYDCSPEQIGTGADYQKAKQRAIKHQLILYKGGKCEKCGYDKCEGALQFHHTNPAEKEFTLSHIILSKNLNMEDLYAEVDKCELLCANCHAEEHFT